MKCLTVLQSPFQIFHQVWIIDFIFVDILMKYINILQDIYLIYYFSVLNSFSIFWCVFQFSVQSSEGKSVENLENWKTIPTDPVVSSLKLNIIWESNSRRSKSLSLRLSIKKCHFITPCPNYTFLSQLGTRN